MTLLRRRHKTRPVLNPLPTCNLVAMSPPQPSSCVSHMCCLHTWPGCVRASERCLMRLQRMLQRWRHFGCRIVCGSWRSTRGAQSIGFVSEAGGNFIAQLVAVACMSFHLGVIPAQKHVHQTMSTALHVYKPFETNARMAAEEGRGTLQCQTAQKSCAAHSQLGEVTVTCRKQVVGT